MQKVAGMRNALSETSAVRRGDRLVFRHAGALVESADEPTGFRLCRGGGGGTCRSRGATRTRCGARCRCRRCFGQAVQLEENPATLAEAAAMYEGDPRGEAGPRAGVHQPGGRSLTTSGHSRRRSGCTVAPRKQTRSTRWAFFRPGGTFWTRCRGCTRRLRLTRRRFAPGAAVMPTRTYNLALAFEAAGRNDGGRCGTGMRTCGWTRWARGAAHAKGAGAEDTRARENCGSCAGPASGFRLRPLPLPHP